MKKLLTIWVVLLLVCNAGKAQVLTVSRNAVQLAWQLNSSDTIKILSNTSWTCNSDQTWLNLSSYEGSGDSIIRLSVSENTTEFSRTAQLVIQGTGVAQQNITITQAASPLLSISTDSLGMEATANSSCSFKIRSFADWSATSNAAWLTLQPSSFHKTETYAGNYLATGVRIHPTAGNFFFNNKMEALTMVDSVTISKPDAGDYPLQVQIQTTKNTIDVGGKSMMAVNVAVISSAGTGMLATDQNGNPTNYFDPSTRTFYLSYFYNTAAPRKIYEIIVGTSSATMHTVTATAAANPTSAIRQAEVTITASGAPDKTVKITQEASPVLAASTNSLLLPAKAKSSITFTINSATNWLIECSTNWLTLSKAAGSKQDTITVTATGNETSSERHATLTITAEGGKTQTINVTQYGLVTADGKWKQFNTGYLYTDLSVVNDTVIWLSRGARTITYTVNGGNTWTTKNLPSNISGNTGFCAVSATTAYIAVSMDAEIGIYKTTDGADTWTLQPTGFSSTNPTNFYGSSFPDFVYFWDINNGLAYGDDNEIYTTSNAGVEWNRAVSNVLRNGTGEWSLAYQSSYKTVGNTIYILVTNQKGLTRILKSNNKGLTWGALSTPTNTMSANFDFKDDNNGLYVDYSSKPTKLYSTKDGGQTWLLLNSSGNLHNLKYIPNQDVYVSTYSANGLLYSADNGQTWNTNPSFTFNYEATYNCAITPDGLTTFVTGNGYAYSTQNIMAVNTTVDTIIITGSTSLDVKFTNNVELTSASDTANYKITYTTPSVGKSSNNLIKSIKILSASRDNSNYALVHLETVTPLPLDTIHVSVSNIYDMNGFPLINGNETSGETFILNFALSTSTLDIGALANSTNTFSITSDVAWEISSDQTWLNTDISSGSGNSVITLSASENPSNESRTAIVRVSSAGGTTQIITVTQDGGTTGLAKDKNTEISLSPNPANNFVLVHGLPANAKVAILDLNGKLLITTQTTGNQIDISKLTKGIYTLRVTDKNGIVTRKLVKR